MTQEFKDRLDRLERIHVGGKDGLAIMLCEELHESELIDALRYLNLMDYAREEGLIELSAPNDSALRKRVAGMCAKYYSELSPVDAVSQYCEEIFTDISEGNSNVFNRLCYLHLKQLL